MKAVNLIPKGERSGAGGVAGRSGGAVYIALGALAAVVVMVAMLALSARSLDDKTADLARVEAQAQASEAKAASLKSYVDFKKLRQARAETVRSIADSRFDWSFVLHELARTIPANVWLTGVTGTVAPGVPLKAKPVTASVRSARGTPALELLGCTTDNDSVAKMMTALRQVDGVRRVALQSALKADPQAGGGASSAGGDCRHGDARYPQFTMAVFFDARPAPAAPAVPSTSTPETP
jgi:Tfp pilus assembly protein PilN